MKRDTQAFLKLLQQQNEAIAAHTEEVEQARVENLDQIRLQRDQARREKYGQLRARMSAGSTGVDGQVRTRTRKNNKLD